MTVVILSNNQLVSWLVNYHVIFATVTAL